jgi:hypothetical protein
MRHEAQFIEIMIELVRELQALRIELARARSPTASQIRAWMYGDKRSGNRWDDDEEDTGETKGAAGLCGSQGVQAR